MKEEFDTYSFHEVLDRTSLVSEMFNDYIVEHPVVEQISILKKRADLIAEALGEYYQFAGVISYGVDEEFLVDSDVVSAAELKAYFNTDSPEILKHFDRDSVLQPDERLQHVTIDLPTWVLHELDFRAELEKCSREEMLVTILQAKVRER